MLRALTIVLALPVTTFAGEVFVVDAANGPGTDYKKLNQAAQLVPEGSTLLVRSGEYEDLRPSGALVVQADAGADVRIQDVFLVDVVDPRGVTIRGVTILTPAIVFGCEGPVWFEDCTMSPDGFPIAGGTPPGPALTVSDSRSVVLNRCTLSVEPTSCAPLSCFSSIEGGTGLEVRSSDVHLYDTHVSGGEGNFSPEWELQGSEGGPAVRMYGGFLFASGGSFDGGRGSTGAAEFGCAKLSVTPGPGGNAVQLFGELEADVFLAGVELSGGLQGTAFTLDGLACANFVPAVAETVEAPPGSVTQLPRASAGFELASPTTTTVELTLTDATEHIVFVGFGTPTISYQTGFQSTLLLGRPLRVLALGEISSDLFELSLDVSDAPAGLRLWAQPFWIDPFGQPSLGPGSMALLLGE